MVYPAQAQPPQQPPQPPISLHTNFAQAFDECRGRDCGSGGENKGLSVNQGADGSVNVTTPNGRYTANLSTATGGKMTVTDNKTGENITVYGDPHIQTGAGGTADFQHSNVTFNLPDGTKITVNPTNNPGVNYINSVTISSNNAKGVDAVKVSGFQSGSLSVKTLSGEAGHRAGAEAERGSIELNAKGGNINDLVGRHGLEIHSKADGNIDGYAPPKGGDHGPHDPGHHDPRHHDPGHHGPGHHGPGYGHHGHPGPGHHGHGGESKVQKLLHELEDLKHEVEDLNRRVHDRPRLEEKAEDKNAAA